MAASSELTEVTRATVGVGDECDLSVLTRLPNLTSLEVRVSDLTRISALASLKKLACTKCVELASNV